MKSPASSSSLLATATTAATTLLLFLSSYQTVQAQPQLDNCTEITGPGLQSNSLYFDQKGDSDEYVLIQILSLGDVSFTSESGECGVDSFHTQTARVLEVKRTVKETSSGVGVSTGVPLQDCNVISFQTSVKDWKSCCAEPEDPGVKEAGWCGYVYLNPSDKGELFEASEFKYVTSAGGQSFESVDESVCAQKMKELNCGAVGGGNGAAGCEVSLVAASIVVTVMTSMALLGTLL